MKTHRDYIYAYTDVHWLEAMACRPGGQWESIPLDMAREIWDRNRLKDVVENIERDRSRGDESN